MLVHTIGTGRIATPLGLNTLRISDSLPIITNVFQYVGGEDKVVGCIFEREMLDIHFMIHSFHAQVGSLVC